MKMNIQNTNINEVSKASKITILPKIYFLSRQNKKNDPL